MRLGRTFVTSAYRTMRRHVLMCEEMTRIPDTLDIARRTKEEANMRREIRDLLTLIHQGRWDLIPDMRNAQIRLHEFRSRAIVQGPSLNRHCAHDNCDHGFVDASGVCGVCDRVTCLHCGVAVHDVDEHRCNNDDVQSMRMIGHECRPCVRCRAPSMRAEGCATMWCTRCHTFWNWETGRIIETKGTVPHNPDHRAWLNETRHREIGDIPCGGLPDGGVIHMALMRFMLERVSASAPFVVQAVETIQMTQRIRPRFPRTWDAATVNLNARISLINGEMTEDSFSRVVERNDRTNRFRRDVGEVLEALVLSGADVLQRFCFERTDLDLAAIELLTLLRVSNDALRQFAHAHGRVGPYLTETFRWVLPNTRAT